MSHHVVVRLPDGRYAVARHDQAAARELRLILRAAMEYREPEEALVEAARHWADTQDPAERADMLRELRLPDRIDLTSAQEPSMMNNVEMSKGGSNEAR